MDRFCTDCNKTVLEILCFLLERDEHVVIGDAAYLDNFQQFPDRLIGEIGAVRVFSDISRIFAFGYKVCISDAICIVRCLGTTIKGFDASPRRLMLYNNT